MIMDAMFDGTFSAETFSRPEAPEYKTHEANIMQLSEKLREKLGAEDYQLVEELLDQMYAAQYLESKACFRAGFAAGVQLQREITDELPFLISES